MSYRFLSSANNFYTTPLQFDRVLTLDSSTLVLYNTQTEFLSNKLNLCLSNITFVSWVNIKGTLYNCKNMCVVVDANQINIMLPTFGLI